MAAALLAAALLAVGGCADGRWRMADGGWQMADGGWQMADGGWRMADGGWRMGAGRNNNAGGAGGRSALPGAPPTSCRVAQVRKDRGTWCARASRMAAPCGGRTPSAQPPTAISAAAIR